MNFQIIKKYITLIIVFFAWTHIASASFEITEIMYDLDGTDTNREWVEVKNTGTDAADLSKWFLFTDNIKHALAPQGESQVPAGGYAVIAQNAPKFKTDWPNFTGLLFDSSWTGFSNDGETLALKDPDQNLVSQITFTSSMGGAGDGNSLQNINGSWIVATPTPGAENQANSGGGGSGSGGTNGGGSTTSTTANTVTTVTKKKEIEVPKIITNIIVNPTVFAGIPFTVDGTTLGYSKETLKFGKFIWNFGDGVVKEENEQTPFQYEYQYPGEYVINLSYYVVYTGKTPDATDRLTIHVIPSQVSISSIGKEGDLFVELENKSSTEVDLSGWALKGSYYTFYIPQGTIILPHQKLKFSQKATNFSSTDVSTVYLQNPIGEISGTSKSRNYSSSSSSSKLSSESSPSTVINLNDLGASSANASSINVSNSTFAWIGLVGVIAVGIVTVILMRRRNYSDSLEKDIRAEDMTIIE